jgi:hypothetical protein
MSGSAWCGLVDLVCLSEFFGDEDVARSEETAAGEAAGVAVHGGGLVRIEDVPEGQESFRLVQIQGPAGGLEDLVDIAEILLDVVRGADVEVSRAWAWRVIGGSLSTYPIRASGMVACASSWVLRLGWAGRSRGRGSGGSPRRAA